MLGELQFCTAGTYRKSWGEIGPPHPTLICAFEVSAFDTVELTGIAWHCHENQSVPVPQHSHTKPFQVWLAERQRRQSTCLGLSVDFS